MAVKIGSARIDEDGNAHGGKAGDQTGREVSVQNWYLHSKGWRVFRAKDPAEAEKIARCMEAACANNHIGYDQWERNTLYKAAEPLGFDVSRVTTDCETDCSALVRVCCAYAGIKGLPSDFRTGNMPANLAKTGRFVELTGDKYQAKSTYLRRGDILVTKTNGHTVVVLSDGPKAEKNVPAGTPAETPKIYALGERVLKKGMNGADVKELQAALNAAGHDCGAVDGDFGPKTDAAVRAFQKAKGLDADGQAGPKTIAALAAAAPAGEASGSAGLSPSTPAVPGETRDQAEAQGAGRVAQVRVVGTAVNVRRAPGTSGKIMGVVCHGDLLEYQDYQLPVDEVPWYLVVYRGANAWISGKYSEIVR